MKTSAPRVATTALIPYQIDSNSASKQEAQVDVNSMVLVLNNPGQTTNDGTNNKGEDEQGLK